MAIVKERIVQLAKVSHPVPWDNPKLLSGLWTAQTWRKGWVPQSQSYQGCCSHCLMLFSIWLYQSVFYWKNGYNTSYTNKKLQDWFRMVAQSQKRKHAERVSARPEGASAKSGVTTGSPRKSVKEGWWVCNGRLKSWDGSQSLCWNPADDVQIEGKDCTLPKNRSQPVLHFPFISSRQSSCPRGGPLYHMV